MLAMNTCNKTKKVVILLGAPGSGKGTQAAYISEKFDIPQISTGDLFRENLRLNTPVGQKAKEYMDKGKLVPDEIVLDMLFDRISKPDCRNGYILDGFPRTVNQAETLSEKLCSSELAVISLEVPDNVIVKRLTGRVVCEKCGAIYHKETNPPKKIGVCDRCGGRIIQRQDDTKAVVVERLKVFHSQTEPVKSYYQDQDVLVLIDGSLSKEKIRDKIDCVLTKEYQW